MDWVHCNSCYVQPGDVQGKKFVITNCGHIYCCDCTLLPDLKKCKVCQSSYNTMLLSSKMTKEVEVYFRDPLEDIQKLLKVLEFQQGHRMRLVTFNRERLIEKKSFAKENSMLKEELKLLRKENMSLREENKRINMELVECQQKIDRQWSHHESRNSNSQNIQVISPMDYAPTAFRAGLEARGSALRRPSDGPSFLSSKSNKHTNIITPTFHKVAGSHRLLGTSISDVLKRSTPRSGSQNDLLHRKMKLPGDRGGPSPATRSAFNRLTLSKVTSTPKRDNKTASKYFQYCLK